MLVDSGRVYQCDGCRTRLTGLVRDRGDDMPEQHCCSEECLRIIEAREAELKEDYNNPNQPDLAPFNDCNCDGEETLPHHVAD